MITPVLLTEVSLPPTHPRAGAACMVFGFVIHHGDGPVLVDTRVGVGHPAIDSASSPVHLAQSRSERHSQRKLMLSDPPVCMVE